MKTFTAIEKDGKHFAPDGRRAYPFACFKCGHGAFAAKSLCMTEFGINSGFAQCSKCGAYLTLKMVPDLDGDRMETEQHPDSGFGQLMQGPDGDPDLKE